MSSWDFSAMMIVFKMGCLGVILDFIDYTMYAKGVLLDELVTGTVTISNPMACTIILFLLVGLVQVALRR
jgi:hypothetical protein